MMGGPLSRLMIGTWLAASLLSAANAAVEAESRITNLSITVADLDPSDGVAPAFSFTKPLTRIALQAAQGGGTSAQDEQEAPAFGAPLTGAVSQGTAAIAIETGADFIHSAGSLTNGLGSFFSDGNFISGIDGGCFGCPPAKPTAFLTPHTTVTISGRLHLHAAITPDSTFAEYARSYFITEAGWSEPGGPFVSLGIYRSWVTAKNQPFDDESFDGTVVRDSATKDEDFSLTLTNNSDDAWHGSFVLYLYTSGYVHELAPPIPEPETSAMMILGLCALCVVARRRRSRP